MWEPNWRTRGTPDIGMYICVKTKDDGGIVEFQQGMVVEINDIIVRLHTDPPFNPNEVYPDALAWKIWIGPEIENTIPRKRTVKV